MFRAKDKAPYEDEKMQEVFLNPRARVTMNKKTATYAFPSTFAETPTSDKKAQETQKMVESLTQSTPSANTKVGVDVETLSSLNIENETFIQRNFTDKEIAYCQKAPSPQASFTGKWSAKEAVFKSLGVQGKGAGAPLKDIEIVNDDAGAPQVQVRTTTLRVTLTIY
jgi:fatty acid synthase subunit alpha